EAHPLDKNFQQHRSTTSVCSRETLELSTRSDFCVGYFNLMRMEGDRLPSWTLAGGDRHCCRLQSEWGDLRLHGHSPRQSIRRGRVSLDLTILANEPKTKLNELPVKLTKCFPLHTTHWRESGLLIGSIDSNSCTPSSTKSTRCCWRTTGSQTRSWT